MESQMERELRKIRKKIKESSPDVFIQAWVGTFDYVFCSHNIVGTVELKFNQISSVADNKKWLYDDTSNVQSIITYLAKNRLTEIPSWNSNITCDITLNDSQTMRYIFVPHDILSDRHSPKIKWEKKLITP
jgi:hypothetical protein